MISPAVHLQGAPAQGPHGASGEERSRAARRLLALSASLALVFAVGAGCSGAKGGGAGRTNNGPETLVPVKPAHQTGSTRAATTTVPATNSQGVVLPAAPNDYATAVYDAWRKGDRSTAAALAQDPAVISLFAKPYAATDKWAFTTCSGKAGSSYCTWKSGKHTLVIRVVNDKLSQPRAVDDASFR